MKMTRQSWTKRVFGISALAGVCLMHGCAWLGTSKDEDIQVVPVVPVDEKEVAGVSPGTSEVAPVKLPSVQLTTPYTVGKGDTLTVIASQYGLRWQDVAAVNPGMNPNRLRIGQVIQLPGKINVADKKAVKRVAPATRLPAPTGKTTSYKVRSGDSLSVIDQRYGVKASSIKAANNLSSDVIRVGQTLKIVGYTKTPSAATAPVAVKTQPVKTPTAAAVVEPVAPVSTDPVVIEVPVTPPPTPAVTLDPAAGVVTPPAATPPAVTPPAATPVAAEAETFRLYTVKEGEDLYAVAIRWGVSPNEIKTLNGLAGHELEAGKTIKIPQEKQP